MAASPAGVSAQPSCVSRRRCGICPAPGRPARGSGRRTCASGTPAGSADPSSPRASVSSAQPLAGGDHGLGAGLAGDLFAPHPAGLAVHPGRVAAAGPPLAPQAVEHQVRAEPIEIGGGVLDLGGRSGAGQPDIDLLHQVFGRGGRAQTQAEEPDQVGATLKIGGRPARLCPRPRRLAARLRPKPAPRPPLADAVRYGPARPACQALRRLSRRADGFPPPTPAVMRAHVSAE